MARLRKTVIEEKQEAFIHLIKYKMDVYHVPSKEVFARRIGIEERTLRNKFKNPKLFKLEEIQLICEMLHFDEAEKLKVI